MNYQSTRNKLLLVFLLSFLIIIYGCSLDNKTAIYPNLDLSTTEINTQIRLFAPVELNTYRFNEPVALFIKNNGKTPVLFLNDFKIRVYMFNNDEWVECESVYIDYSNGDKILHPTGNDPIKFGSTMIEPIIENQSQPIKIRIIVSGNRYIDNIMTDQKVAAYTDVWLFPDD